MLLLGKVGLGLAGTMALAGAYAFHEGVVRVDVDEFKPHGTHVHLCVPAAIVPVAVRLVPDNNLQEAAREAAPWMPAARAAARELATYPDAAFVEIRNADQHVRIRTRDGKLHVDVETPEESVHAACTPRMLEDVFSQLEARGQDTR